MNWFHKYSSPALLEPTRGRKISPPHGDVNSGLQLFNYIKSQNIRVPMYHGTMLSRYIQAQSVGYLLGADYNKKPANNITPTEDRKFVFITTRRDYAEAYAFGSPLIDRKIRDMLVEYGFAPRKLGDTPNYYESYKIALERAIQDVNNNPQKYMDCGVIITINMPLYAITEVRDAILGGMKPRNIGDKLNIYNHANKDALIKDIMDEIGASSVLTSYIGIPLKWATAVEKLEDPRGFINVLKKELNRQLGQVNELV